MAKINFPVCPFGMSVMVAFWERNATGAITALTDFHRAETPPDSAPVNPRPFQIGPSLPPNGNDVFAKTEADSGNRVVRVSRCAEGLKYLRVHGCSVSRGVTRSISRREKPLMLHG